MNKIDVIIDALSVARNSVWSTLNQEALAYAIELKLELAKPEPQVCCGDYEKCIKACTPRGRWLAEKELVKPEQEPVAWMYKGNFHDFDPSEWASPEFVVTPLYTAPPRKKWVGLTEDDMHTIRGDAFNKNVDDMNWAVMMARKIDFILKERNK
jgi:hypothetical protein